MERTFRRLAAAAVLALACALLASYWGSGRSEAEATRALAEDSRAVPTTAVR